MEEEFDREYLAKLLEDPKNLIFCNLADHLLENCHLEFCEPLLLSIEKCRLYVDCIKGYFLFPTLSSTESEELSGLKEYRVMLLLMTSVLFEEASLVTHAKEITKDSQPLQHPQILYVLVLRDRYLQANPINSNHPFSCKNVAWLISARCYISNQSMCEGEMRETTKRAI